MERRASLRYTPSSIEVPMANGNIMKIPIGKEDKNSDINISEELNRSGIWKSVDVSNSVANTTRKKER